MWTFYRRTPNRLVAEMWKELFENEGIPCQLAADQDFKDLGEAAPTWVLIPTGREHVAEEVIRELQGF